MPLNCRWGATCDTSCPRVLGAASVDEKLPGLWRRRHPRGWRRDVINRNTTEEFRQPDLGSGSHFQETTPPLILSAVARVAASAPRNAAQLEANDRQSMAVQLRSRGPGPNGSHQVPAGPSGSHQVLTGPIRSCQVPQDLMVGRSRPTPSRQAAPRRTCDRSLHQPIRSESLRFV